MKISVCIPVYNFEIENLVFSLKKEIDKFQLNAEIILIDDASSENFARINEPLKKVVNQFIFLEKNIGRSAIRNLFLNYVSGDYMLFLDCDAQIISEKFIKNYIDFLEKNTTAEVVFGGRIPPPLPAKDFILRWKYSKIREFVTIENRINSPYLSFQSNNFIIVKKVFENNLFDEELKGYGYEDLLFSMVLKKNEIQIFHIENYISNLDIETNINFIRKSEEASKNLSLIYKSIHSYELISEIRLVQFYKKLKYFKLDKIFLSFFKSNRKIIRNLLSKYSSLYLLDLYKLGVFSENI